MTESLLAGLAAGYGVAVPVGAIAVLIMGLSARTSPRVGVAAALGVATADGLYAAVAVVGGAALAGLIEPAAGVLRWIAAAVLFGMAAWTATAALRRFGARPGATGVPTRDRPAIATPGRAFAALLALTALNPATIVYFAALVIGRQAAQGFTPAAAVVFVLAVCAASASWQVLIAAGGSMLGRVLSGPRGRLGTALVSSVGVGALAVTMVLRG